MKVRIFDDPNLRMKRRERVGSDSGPGMRNGGEQSRFAGIGISYQADLGDNPQLQQKFAFFTRFARLSKARGLAGCGREIAIALTAAAAFAQYETLAVL